MKFRLSQLALLFVVALTSMGAGTSISQRYDQIGHKLVCVCGCTQILLECNHVGCPDSDRMIGELRMQLASGGTDTSIFNWFAAKYGPTVLGAPMRGGFDTVAWVVPALLTFLALGLVVWLVSRWKRRVAPAIAGSASSLPPSDDLRERIRRETEY